MADLQAELARFEAEVADVSTTASPPQQAAPGQGQGYGQAPFRPPGQPMGQPPPWQAALPGGFPRMPGPPRPPMGFPMPPPRQPQAPGPGSYAASYAAGGPSMHSPGHQIQATYSAAPQQSSQYSAGPSDQAAPQLAPQPSAAPAQMQYQAAASMPLMSGDAKAVAAAHSAAVVQPGKKQSEVYTNIQEAFASQKASKKPRYGMAREAAGKKWIDPNLLEWPEDDFRVFVGDLGNETNDEVLTKAFQKYASFNKAKVVRDKKSNKTKGFGFVSFSDPIEGAKALREMDGKYVGNRPCKLKKSSWVDRNQEEQKFVPGGRKKNHILGGVAKKSGILHR